MAATIALAHSPRTRYLTGAIMYFAQGIPQGLLSIAIPAWLASRGVAAGQIASYMAVIVLPWAFKLVTGPFMDRFQFLPMGRRRPWVLGAQLGLTVSLLLLGLIRDPVEQIGLLMLIGVIVNSFAATQDVAVDGMSIDLTPVDEQGRLNAFMSFGKAVGWAVTAAVSGVLLVQFGMQVTAVVAAATAGVIFLMAAVVVEREGERRFPWSSGAARSAARPSRSFTDVFRGINEVLWLRTSLLVLAIMAFDGMITGYGQALMPVAAVKLFNYTTPEWSRLVAIMGLVGAGVALVLGPLIDRYGARRMLTVAGAAVALHAFLLANTQILWHDSTYVRVMLSIWVLMLPVVMVCVIALAMAVCNSKLSATQFAVYMSVSNLGYSVGSKIFGMVVDFTTYDETWMLLGMLVVALLIVLFAYGQNRPEGTPGAKHVRVYTVSTTGGGAGLYFSGHMRCPKCRSDMEPVTHGDIEVDRCHTCGGLWFDAGEVEKLKSREAAEAIDTGSARLGRRLDMIDHYRCPRCGDEMTQVSDPEQPHIHFETCSGCGGSFFDAGEFRDLSEHTLSDYFKDLLAHHRH